MKKKKTVVPFFFKDQSHQEVVDQFNNDYPVNLKYNEDLVNRVHARYPLIDKIQVSIITKAIFQSFRDLLVLGKVLNFNNLFFDCKLLAFPYIKNGVIVPALKVKISTPQPLRQHDK